MASLLVKRRKGTVCCWLVFWILRVVEGTYTTFSFRQMFQSIRWSCKNLQLIITQLITFTQLARVLSTVNTTVRDRTTNICVVVVFALVKTLIIFHAVFVYMLWTVFTQNVICIIFSGSLVIQNLGILQYVRYLAMWSQDSGSIKRYPKECDESMYQRSAIVGMVGID